MSKTARLHVVAGAVLDTTELLDSIMLHMNDNKTLVDLQRVNVRFKGVIQRLFRRDDATQKRTFMKPCSFEEAIELGMVKDDSLVLVTSPNGNGPTAFAVLNTLVLELIDAPRVGDRHRVRKGIRHHRNSGVRGKGLWETMYLTQPPQQPLEPDIGIGRKLSPQAPGCCSPARGELVMSSGCSINETPIKASKLMDIVEGSTALEMGHMVDWAGTRMLLPGMYSDLQMALLTYAKTL